MRNAVLTLLAMFLLVLSGCGGDGGAEENQRQQTEDCGVDSDCEEHETCDEGQCVDDGRDDDANDDDANDDDANDDDTNDDDANDDDANDDDANDDDANDDDTDADDCTGDSDCEEHETCDEGQCVDGNAPPTPSLTVSPDVIVPGESVLVEWASEDATECHAPATEDGLPGWSGSKTPTGSEEISLASDLAPGEYGLQLVCSNQFGDSPHAEVHVVLSEPVDPCADRQPPQEMTRASHCSVSVTGVDCHSYEEFFGGFPGTTSIRHFTLSPDHYAAMAFTPEEIPPSARLDLNSTPIQGWDIPHGQLLWSISTCPGDFNITAIEEEMGDDACVVHGPNAMFGFRFGGSDFVSASNRCGLALEPGTTYYLNIVYTNDDPLTTPSTELSWACGVAPSYESCGHQIQPTSIANW